ncbi:PIN domain-containing protein, partial [bacterium]|nr:PIN domain-containing protein [bacterium]
MKGSIFLDTNVLVYAYDRSEPVKQSRAVAFLDELSSVGVGAVSTQVLGELFVALTGKIRIPLSQK